MSVHTYKCCEHCGEPLRGKRAHAQYCDSSCRADATRVRQELGEGAKALRSAQSGGVGSRGGNVRSVEEARKLQSESKELDRWRLVMELQVHRTLVETGAFHVDDLDDLNLPPAAFGVRGTLVNSIRCTGVMESTGVYRKVAHAAANARKAPIYRITPKGRADLPSKLAGCSAAEVRGGSPASGENPAPVVHRQTTGPEASSLPASGPSSEPVQLAMLGEPEAHQRRAA